MFEKFGEEWRKNDNEIGLRHLLDCSLLKKEDILYFDFYMSRSKIDLFFISENMKNTYLIELILLTIEVVIYILIKLGLFFLLSYIMLIKGHGQHYKTADNPTF